MNREEILNKATKCVMRDRNATHGEPKDNFKDIADLWTAYFHKQFTSIDVAVMMILMKSARIRKSPECQDHWIDIAGYAACGGGIATKEEGQ